MKNIATIEDLDDSILMLEIKLAGETQLFKEQIHHTYERLRPVNLIKNAFHDLVSAPDFKGGIFNSMLSNSAGFLSKKIMTGSTLNPLKIISGNLLQMIVTSIVAKNTDTIKRAATNLITKIVSKKNTVV